jgi:hypothetical protein
MVQKERYRSNGDHIPVCLAHQLLVDSLINVSLRSIFEILDPQLEGSQVRVHNGTSLFSPGSLNENVFQKIET